jgi:hypothetical protein
VEQSTGQAVAQSLGDCAYGSGESRQAFAAAGRELVAKVPQESDNQGLFPKWAFVIDLEQNRVTCPGGQTTTKFTRDKAGGQTFQFGRRCHGCPLRAHCTTATGGRTLQVHPHVSQSGCSHRTVKARHCSITSAPFRFCQSRGRTTRTAPGSCRTSVRIRAS